MKIFILGSYVLNAFGVVLVSALVILPEWYFGVGTNGQRILQISFLLMMLIQILAAYFWSRKSENNFFEGILPILIPIGFYFSVAQQFFQD